MERIKPEVVKNAEVTIQIEDTDYGDVVVVYFDYKDDDLMISSIELEDDQCYIWTPVYTYCEKCGVVQIKCKDVKFTSLKKRGKIVYKVRILCPKCHTIIHKLQTERDDAWFFIKQY